jgi:hypothetical protein
VAGVLTAEGVGTVVAGAVPGVLVRRRAAAPAAATTITAIMTARATLERAFHDLISEEHLT